MDYGVYGNWEKIYKGNREDTITGKMIKTIAPAQNAAGKRENKEYDSVFALIVVRKWDNKIRRWNGEYPYVYVARYYLPCLLLG